MMKNKMYHILVLPPPTINLANVFMCQLSKLIVCFRNQWIDGTVYYIRNNKWLWWASVIF